MKNNFIFIIMVSAIAIACGSTKSLLTPKQLSSMNYQEVKGFVDAESDSIELDQYPMYPNGLQGLTQDILKHVKYPEKARKNNIQGIVLVGYIIEKNGYISNITVLKSVSKELDEEAIRVVKKFSRWYPAIDRNLPVRVQFKQPFSFKLK